MTRSLESRLYRSRLIALVACVIALPLGVPGASAGSRQQFTPCTAAWSEASPAPASEPITVRGIGAVSPSDVWAVGSWDSREFGKSVFAEHWDGASWQPFPVPDDPGQDLEFALNGVSGESASDVWAVGRTDFTDEGGPVPTPLIEHFDGTSWSVVPSPSQWGYTLEGVAAIDPSTAWAVGYNDNPDDQGEVPPLIERWDGTGWSAVSTDVGAGELFGITALSASDIWAVGDTGNEGKALIEHWDGTSWATVPAPNLTEAVRLTAVSGSSSNDIWAVGEINPYFGGGALIEHWNGSAWSVVAAPAGSPLKLTAVAALSPTNAWAAGNGVIEHWDGATWAVSTTIAGAGDIAAAGPSDVWTYGPPFSHWNGSSWQPVSSATGVDLPTTLAAVTPSGDAFGSFVDVFGRRRTFGPSGSANVGSQDNRLRGAADLPSGGSFAVGDYVGAGEHHALIESFASGLPDSQGPAGILRGASADATTDAWAAGSTSDGRTLVERFDGTSWAMVPSPNAGSGDNSLNDIAAISPSDVWGVGTADVGGVTTTLVEHYDGSTWSIVSSPNAGSGDNQLGGLFASSPDDVWAVGFYRADTGALRTLVEHWDGTAWSIVPSPNQGVGDNTLSSVSGRAGAAPWAVGRALLPSGQVALVEFWDGAVWRRMTLVGDAATPGASLAGVASNGSRTITVGTIEPVGAGAQPFGQTVCPVKVFDDGFVSQPLPVGPGQEVFWQTEPEDTAPHIVADASGLGLFASSPLPPGALFGASLNGAGTYSVVDPTNGATSTIAVSILAPAQVLVRQSFVVRWAAHNLRPGLVFDVQFRRSTGPWTVWFRGTRSFQAARTLRMRGDWYFRARVRKQGTMTATGWSPPTLVWVN